MPTSIVINLGDVNYVVQIAVDTSILNVLWMRTSLVNFRVGDTVRVYGFVYANAHTVEATVVRDTNIGWFNF